MQKASNWPLVCVSDLPLTLCLFFCTPFRLVRRVAALLFQYQSAVKTSIFQFAFRPIFQGNLSLLTQTGRLTGTHAHPHTFPYVRRRCPANVFFVVYVCVLTAPSAVSKQIGQGCQLASLKIY